MSKFSEIKTYITPEQCREAVAYVAETGYTARGKDLYKGETDCGWINYGTVSAVIEAGKTYWCNFDLPSQPL